MVTTLAVGDAAGGALTVSTTPLASVSAVGCTVGDDVGLEVAVLLGTRTVLLDAEFGTCGTGMKQAVNKNASPSGTSAWMHIFLNLTLLNCVFAPYRLSRTGSCSVAHTGLPRTVLRRG